MKPHISRCLGPWYRWRCSDGSLVALGMSPRQAWERYYIEKAKVEKAISFSFAQMPMYDQYHPLGRCRWNSQ